VYRLAIARRFTVLKERRAFLYPLCFETDGQNLKVNVILINMKESRVTIVSDNNHSK